MRVIKSGTDNDYVWTYVLVEDEDGFQFWSVSREADYESAQALFFTIEDQSSYIERPLDGQVCVNESFFNPYGRKSKHHKEVNLIINELKDKGECDMY